MVVQRSARDEENDRSIGSLQLEQCSNVLLFSPVIGGMAKQTKGCIDTTYGGETNRFLLGYEWNPPHCLRKDKGGGKKGRSKYYYECPDR